MTEKYLNHVMILFRKKHVAKKELGTRHLGNMTSFSDHSQRDGLQKPQRLLVSVLGSPSVSALLPCWVMVRKKGPAWPLWSPGDGLRVTLTPSLRLDGVKSACFPISQGDCAHAVTTRICHYLEPAWSRGAFKAS